MNDIDHRVYVANPLSNSRDIRILDIHPADDFGSPIYCSLKVANIDHSNTKYQTLSYTWGSSDASETIFCDGKPFKVTPNLQLALRNIRDKISPKDLLDRTVWIDAICINQADEREKSTQIEMMGEIYEKSIRLIIWLGDASTDEIEAWRAAMKCPKEAKSIKLLGELTSRPWFRRLWVVQEIFKSQKGRRHVLLGGWRFRFDLLIMSCSTARILENGGPVLQQFWLGHIGNDVPSLWYRMLDRLPPLLDNLARFQEAEASEAHDRIFALVNISDPATTVSVDYRQTFETLCIDLAKESIRREVGLCSLLMRAIEFRPACRSDTLPSWAPDWRMKPGLLNFHTTDQIVWDHEDDIKSSVEAETLRLQAWPLKPELFSPNEHCPQCDKTMSRLRSWLERCGKLQDVLQGAAVVITFMSNVAFLLVPATSACQSWDCGLFTLHSYCWPEAIIGFMCDQQKLPRQRFDIV